MPTSDRPVRLYGTGRMKINMRIEATGKDGPVPTFTYIQVMPNPLAPGPGQLHRGFPVRTAEIVDFRVVSETEIRAKVH